MHTNHEPGTIKLQLVDQYQLDIAHETSDSWVEQVNLSLSLKKRLLPIIVHELPTSLHISSPCGLQQLKEKKPRGCYIPPTRSAGCKPLLDQFQEEFLISYHLSL